MPIREWSRRASFAFLATPTVVAAGLRVARLDRRMRLDELIAALKRRASDPLPAAPGEPRLPRRHGGAPAAVPAAAALRNLPATSARGARTLVALRIAADAASGLPAVGAGTRRPRLAVRDRRRRRLPASFRSAGHDTDLRVLAPGPGAGVAFRGGAQPPACRDRLPGFREQYERTAEPVGGAPKWRRAPGAVAHPGWRSERPEHESGAGRRLPHFRERRFHPTPLESLRVVGIERDGEEMIRQPAGAGARFGLPGTDARSEDTSEL